MRLAIAIAAEEALPSAFVVWRGFERSLEKASRLGYDGVELALRSADEIDPDWLSLCLERHGLEVSCITTGRVFAELGLCFTHPDADRRDRVIEVFEDLVELAKDFGRMVNVGRARGMIAEGQLREEAQSLFAATAREICAFAADRGVEIVLEPVNRYEINLVNSVDDGADLIGLVGAPNLGLMPDTFHMNIEDASIGRTLARHGGLIRYVHLADSNRLAPGQGHLDFDDVFDGLRMAGFDGWASIEVLPLPDPDTAAAQAIRYIAPMIAAYNAAVHGQ